MDTSAKELLPHVAELKIQISPFVLPQDRHGCSSWVSMNNGDIFGRCVKKEVFISSEEWDKLKPEERLPFAHGKILAAISDLLKAYAERFGHGN